MVLFSQKRIHSKSRFRNGTAAMELALVLPVLLLLFFIATDFARVIYPLVTITNCARNGALYLSDPTTISQSPYASYQEAALADSKKPDNSSLLNPALATANVTSSSGSGTSGNLYTQVTVTYNVPMRQSFLGFSLVPLSRTVRMPVVPNVPNF